MHWRQPLAQPGAVGGLGLRELRACGVPPARSRRRGGPEEVELQHGVKVQASSLRPTQQQQGKRFHLEHAAPLGVVALRAAPVEDVVVHEQQRAGGAEAAVLLQPVVQLRRALLDGAGAAGAVGGGVKALVETVEVEVLAAG